MFSFCPSSQNKGPWTFGMLGYKDAQHIYVHLEYFRCKRQKAQPKHITFPGSGDHRRSSQRLPASSWTMSRENGQFLCQEEPTLGPRRNPTYGRQAVGIRVWLQRVPPQYPSQFKSHKIKESIPPLSSYSSISKELFPLRKTSGFSIPPLDKWLDFLSGIYKPCTSHSPGESVSPGYSCPFSCAIRLWAPGGWPRCARHGTRVVNKRTDKALFHMKPQADGRVSHQCDSYINNLKSW